MVAPALTTNATSSSTKLWATASKEWVITPKPKPGRKPKKDLNSAAKPEEDVQLDTKGRRVQNRAAQRAFRERKQSQLAELQARVQSYEQGEIERNVALQNIAKRLKEENETLRAENAALREKLSKAGQPQKPSQENDKKRWRDDSPLFNPVNKRAKPGDSSSASSPFAISYTPSPPSMVSSPDSTSDISCSPLPAYDVSQDSGQTTIPNIMDFPHVKAPQIDHSSFSTFDCGFCSEDTPCVCRELVVQQAQTMHRMDFKPGSYTQATPVLQTTIQLDPPTSPQPCALDSLPPYQPPVPLRRRPVTSNVNSIFAVAPPVQQGVPANCSGDPSNCLACADDAFGKAFCSAIEESVSSRTTCADCPCSLGASRSRDNLATPTASCRESTGCETTAIYPPSGSSIQNESTTPETMPTNDAWQQIKSHPNVAFADLRLLAEVVARRSKCTGPRVVISPALGSVTPERTVSPAAHLPAENEPVLLTDPHAHFREKERERSNGPTSSPKLAAQDVLIECGRQRVREVQADAVRAALRLLDGNFV